MEAARFIEEQIIGILREQEPITKTVEVCRKHAISEATFYARKAKLGGMEVSNALVKALEAENTRLKKLLVDAMLDIAVLKDVAAKMATPAARRNAVSAARTEHDISERRACEILRLIDLRFAT